MAIEQAPRFDAPRAWTELEAELRALNSVTEFQRIRQELLSRVTEWRSADSDAYQPTPFYKELYKMPIPRLRKDQTGKVEHGLSADGSILVMRCWPWGDHERFSEQFVVRKGNLQDKLSYLGRWPEGNVSAAPEQLQLNGISRYCFDSGRLVWHQSLDPEGGRSLHLYDYRECRLTTATYDSLRKQRNREGLDEMAHLHRDYRYAYGEEGQLDSIESDFYRVPKGQRVITETHFRRKKKPSGPSLMRPKTAKKEFAKRIKESGKSISQLTAEHGIALMLDFYRSARAEGCHVKEDGDMLLFQWGASDSGPGKTWQCDITRQFIESGSEGDDAISQLSLTFDFAPSAQAAAVPAGNKWCNSPDELAEFEGFIKSSEAYRACTDAKPATVSLKYGGV